MSEPRTNGSAGGGKSKIEHIYQKKSQLEHILLRPDSYIGSVEHTKELMWVFDTIVTTDEITGESTSKGRMIQREISFCPGLYKIFDEILVNAADNKQRDKHMSAIRIDINPETNTVSIWNNGKGIPVVMHKTEKMFVPTMIFGHLLTSSNYNDDEEKVTGGRNGYGAKLCNIFSTKFTVETASREYKKQFKQTWADNMSKASEPKVADFRGDDFTKITFSPDLVKFKMETLDADIVALMSRRAYDVAASSRGVSVFLNGEKLKIKNFKDYVDLYLRDPANEDAVQTKLNYENCNERWEIALALSDRGFQQVSFVNSIATTKGGRHVDHVVDLIVKQLTEILKKKNKGGINIKPFQIKNHMFIFVNCLIVNPTFDSQTKENMTLQAKSFGSKCVISDKFMTQVQKSGIVESVLSWAKYKAQNDLAKTSGKKNSKIRGIPKLEDANDAGTKNSLACTLILTEGDSAKSLAVAGLGTVGRDLYGVFPLRGKLLNVREATHKQILENAEINNLIKIVGLQYKKKYLTMDDVKTLRYGKIMIMTDQDQDGSHIKGLLINFIHTNWPELLRQPFLEEFITPIVKAKRKGHDDLSFYSLPEFEEWKAAIPNVKVYNIKYYKGLGTSTALEAKEYFSNMDRHRIIFKYNGTQDDESIVMAFAKKAVDQRKEWLSNHMEDCKRRKELGLQDQYLYTKTTKEISYSEFVNLELVLFSNADNVRSIPCVVDGFKPGQRKIMFTCFLRNDKKEVKVAQLAGSVAEKSAYHHGEVSLCMTIVNLAQNFVGSNNINLLMPNGQFGTRLSGGKDSASARYIFTQMSPLTRLIFHPHDDPLLQYQYEDNQRIEPVWYMPVIPMVLVNGCEGIGTGWSTKIANHNPRQIINCLRAMILGEEPENLAPWYKGFNGAIESGGALRYITVGNVAVVEDTKIEITELPVGTWTQTFKENVLEPLLSGNEKIKAIVSDYKEYHTHNTVRFVISFSPGEFDRLEREDGGFHRVFKLTSSISLACMHAFDANGCLKKYERANDILQDFYLLRLEYYQKRKDYLEGMLKAESDRLTDQARFILEKCNNTLVVENKKRKSMIDELIRRGYRPDPVKEWKAKVSTAVEEEEEDGGDGEGEEGEEESPAKASKKKPSDPDKDFQKLTDVKKFDYLLGMSMWMLTEERKNDLLKQRDSKLAELATLRAKTPESIWRADLDALEKGINEYEAKERRDEELGATKKSKQAKQAVAAKAAKGGRKRVERASDFFPANDGIKVEFKVTAEMLKKYEKLLNPGVKRTKKEGVKEGVKEGEEDEVDEFDALVNNKKKEAKEPNQPKELKEPKPKKEPKEKKATDGMKQSKLDFSGSKGKKNKKGDGSDDDDVVMEATPPKREPTSRRAASKKVNYAALCGEGDDDSDEFGNGDAAPLRSAFDSDDDEELFDNDPEVHNASANTSDDLFNSLKSNESDTKKTTPAAKRKLGAKAEVVKPPAKRTKKPSESEDSSPIKKPISKKKKKKLSSSEEEDNDDDDDSDFDF